MTGGAKKVTDDKRGGGSLGRKKKRLEIYFFYRIFAKIRVPTRLPHSPRAMAAHESMDDGALTDAPGCKGRSGDELENEPGAFTDESDDDMDDAATAAEAAAVDKAVDTLFVRAIKSTVDSIVNPALPPSQHVPAPVAAAVVEMLSANMQARAARWGLSQFSCQRKWDCPL